MPRKTSLLQSLEFTYCSKFPTAVTVNWTKVGNFAGELDNGTATLPIADDQGRHVFTIADGPGFRRVDGGMGLLSDDCQS